jgi:hypothetical protein
MYLGFASGSGMAELEEGLHQLREQYATVRQRLAGLTAEPDMAGAEGRDPGPASPAPSVEVARTRPLVTQREITRTKALLAKLERKIEARTKALPLYEATLDSGKLIRDLRSQRDNPVHTLLRRMYYEMGANNSSSKGRRAAAPHSHGRNS